MVSWAVNYHQTVYKFGTGASWEGNRRSGVALATRHRHRGLLPTSSTAKDQHPRMALFTYHGSGPDHLESGPGEVKTLVDSLTRPNFAKVKNSDVSATSADMLVIAFHFIPLNDNQTLFSRPYGGLAVRLKRQRHGT